jgi:hypothetical protein
MTKNIKVRYEFYTYDSSKGSTTLVFDNPAEVTFICTGSGVADAVIINNAFRISSTIAFTSGVATYPNSLTLKNNNYEIDKTTYTIRVLGLNSQCQVIVKYFDYD